MNLHVHFDITFRFPEALRVILITPATRLVFVKKGPNPIMPTPISTLSVQADQTSEVIELDAFAGATDLGPDTNGVSFSSSDTGIATVNNLGGGQLTVTGVVEGSATITGTDAAGLSATLSVSVTAPPPPPADNVQFVSLP